jgi:Family of unknown function (DUF6325)
MSRDGLQGHADADAQRTGELIMSWGPVEWMVVEFPGSRFRGEIVPELSRLVDAGTVRIVDLLVVHKDQAGVARAVELDDLDPDELAVFDHLDGEVMGLLSDEDIDVATADLLPGSTAAMLVWENVWAAPLATAVRDAGGRILGSDRVPHDVVEAAVRDAELTDGVTA